MGKKVSRDESTKVPAVTRFGGQTHSEILSSKQVCSLVVARSGQDHCWTRHRRLRSLCWRKLSC